MQIEVQLRCVDNKAISFDYLYSLHSAIMGCLSASHAPLAHDIHDGIHKNRAKLICFSPFNGGKAVAVPGEKRKKLQLGPRTYFRIASPIPEFLNAIGESLLRQGQLHVNGKSFTIANVNMTAPPEFQETMNWRPFGSSSSIVTAWTSPGKQKRYIRPGESANGEPPVEEILKQNLFTKFNKRLMLIREDIGQAWLRDSGIESLVDETAPVKISLLSYKDGIPFKKISTKNKDTVIYSWRCPMNVAAPVALQRLLWSCGFGGMNFQGFGLMQEGKG